MGENKKPKRPRPAKRRTLPPDAKSLVEMIGALSCKLALKAEHLQKEPHDYRSRSGFRFLFEQRAAAFRRLAELNAAQAAELAQALNLRTEAEIKIQDLTPEAK